MDDKSLVLFVAAETSDHETIRLGKEFREVREETERHGKLDFHPLWAARGKDLNRALRDLQPGIVHFSGHGTSEGLFLLDSDGDGLGILGEKAVRSIFDTFGRGKIRIVVFNSCYSALLAREVAKYVDVVVGMAGAVGIDAATHFSRGFYGGLSLGESAQEAFHMAVTEIETNLTTEQRKSYGHEPQIHCRPGVRAWEVFATQRPTTGGHDLKGQSSSGRRVPGSEPNDRNLIEDIRGSDVRTDQSSEGTSSGSRSRSNIVRKVDGGQINVTQRHE